MMIPVVKNYDSHERETIEEYLSRWPAGLSNIPANVIEQWMHRHNPQFIEDWGSYDLPKWVFTLQYLPIEDVMRIEHLDGELEHWDYVGDTYLFTEDPYQWLAHNIRALGTFPEPIIVAHNAGSVLHPKSRPNEYMKSPYQLIEGHRRLGFIRAMYRQNVPTLQKTHSVWLVKNIG